MRGIEVKYRVYDLSALERELTARGAETFARLRSEHGRCVFTVKRPLDNEMACVEHETAVADRLQMHHAVIAMGFWPTVRIVKTRRSARFGDMAVCVDEVEHAGLFFEVEKVLGADCCPVAVQGELDAFARSLGVPLERVTDTYDSLVAGALTG